MVPGKALQSFADVSAPLITLLAGHTLEVRRTSQLTGIAAS